MQKQGYPVFPPRFRTMEKLTLRAIKLTKQIRHAGLAVIEVHPASTRKALKMPAKDWSEIQTIFVDMGLKGDITTRKLSTHEIDAVTAALTGCLHLKQKTELIGDRREGYIVVPLKTSWRRLKLWVNDSKEQFQTRLKQDTNLTVKRSHFWKCCQRPKILWRWWKKPSKKWKLSLKSHFSLTGTFWKNSC